jgi:hypothetical protein
MRTCLWSRAVLAAIAVGLAALLFAGSALAVRPVPRAHYFGLPAESNEAGGFVDATGELVVSPSARSVAPVTLRFYCPGGGNAVPARLSGPAGRRLRVAQNGRFATKERRNSYRYRARYRLRGRFVSAEFARIVYTERRLRSRRVVCRSAMKLYRNGVPPFSGCRSQRAATVLWGDSGRLFLQYAAVRPGSGGEFGLGSFFTHLYACLFESASKRIDLGENYAPDDYRENFRLAGQFVAFFRTGCALCIWPQASIEVRDARTGSLVSKPDVRYWTRLSDLELKANGSVAWALERLALRPDGYPIGYQTEPPVIETREAWALDSHGQRLLDSGLDLVADSLELSGSTLYWLNGTTARAAALD